ncbi:cytochrome bc1 complex cytochrome b subunit [Pseudonocardia halophobica]|uniref:cytochrome bc1 complex cytochrome b subunit n=1 Tax=Pseudonocardia halophobica TaxID=29401 RepID=UPI003D8F43EF
MDRRFRLAGAARRQASHVFPKHHSFFWGEFALYSFAVLVLSGVYLALFFVPDTTEVVYSGPYEPAQGLFVSRAYESVLTLSFEIRAGLFVRQLHHWAALLFVAAMVLHMCRNFFTGAFRRPRELTWLGGVALLGLGIFEGYLGYSMLDDLLSGLGVRILSGLLLSVPLVGSWLHWMVFGGEFDGDIWISRFFTAHVFLIPGLLVALIAMHVGLVWYQKHTQFPGPGARESNVVGERAVPGFGTDTLANGLCVLAVLGLLGGVFQINPVFLWGPYTPAAVSTYIQPDWYAGFLIGGLRLFPRWEIHLGAYTVPAPLWPGLVLPLLLFALLAAYPFLERRATGDRGPHQLLQRPRDNPVRTGIGAMGLTFYGILFASGATDVIAASFDLPFEYLVWAGRIGLIVLPPLAYTVTRRLCVGLQRADRDVLERGVRTGVLTERPDGVFLEVRRPPGGADHAGRPIPLDYGGARVDHRPVTPSEPVAEEQR